MDGGSRFWLEPRGGFALNADGRGLLSQLEVDEETEEGSEAATAPAASPAAAPAASPPSPHAAA